MEVCDIHTYKGYQVTAFAISHDNGGGWDAAVYIGKLRGDKVHNLEERSFHEFCNPLSDKEDAIAAGLDYAKRLIDQEIFGLHI